MTKTEKATATRRRNKALRDAAFRESLALERAAKATVLAVLCDETMTNADKLAALCAWAEIRD